MRSTMYICRECEEVQDTWEAHHELVKEGYRGAGNEWEDDEYELHCHRCGGPLETAARCVVCDEWGFEDDVAYTGGAATCLKCFIYQAMESGLTYGAATGKAQEAFRHKSFVAINFIALLAKFQYDSDYPDANNSQHIE